MFFFGGFLEKTIIFATRIIGKRYGYGRYTKHFRYVYANIVLIE